jgi:hypothetical protein
VESAARNIAGLLEGNPGAAVVAADLLRCFPDSALAMLQFLAAHGPRGEDLWLRFNEGCGGDVGRLGLDVLARMSERQPSLSA